jgi:uncharacterized short protein YbdD (DUF466 family)
MRRLTQTEQNYKHGVAYLLRRFWARLREWCGDAAYERYLRSKHSDSASSPALSAKKFYVEQIERRYSQPNRCC